MIDTESLVFLLALGALFACARLLGNAADRLRCPAVVGEILAGIFAGKTVLGRLWPDAYAWLFDDHGAASTMLSGYKLVAIVLLLAVAGLEIERGALRRARALTATAALSAALPFAAGYITGLLLPDSLLADPSKRELHALFLGVALSISALPVITRTLMDLGLLKTELGSLVLSVAVVNDIVGWTCFSALGREIAAKLDDGHGVAMSLAITVGFAAVALLVLRPIAGVWLGHIARAVRPARSTASSLSMVIIIALLGAAATERLGIHAMFGGFIVGVAIGQSPQLTEHTRAVLQDCVASLFTPVFFATMALRCDFVQSFDPVLVAIVLAVASVAKIAGSALGARIGGFAWRRAWAVGFGLNSRGAMEILLAAIALESGMINDRMFVALVIMAIVTSLTSGPAMMWLLRTRCRADA